jgi:hypothetical protein
MTYAVVRKILTAAGMLALAAGWSPIAAQTKKSSDGAPYKIEALPPAPGFEEPKAANPKDEKDPGLELPTKFGLGSSQLRLDTNRKEIDPIPRVGIDAADPTVLNPNLPQEKASPLKPGYFGFTISTPTH